MNTAYKFFPVLLALAFSTFSHAQTDLIGSIKPSAGSAVIEIGLSSDQKIQGLQFDIKAPQDLSFGQAKLDRCLDQLPKAFSASTCTQIDERTIRVVVLSLSGEEVPSGFFGRIFLPISAKAGDRGQKVRFSREMTLSSNSLNNIQFSNVVIGAQGGEKIEADFAGMAVERGSQ